MSNWDEYEKAVNELADTQARIDAFNETLSQKDPEILEKYSKNIEEAEKAWEMNLKEKKLNVEEKTTKLIEGQAVPVNIDHSHSVKTIVLMCHRKHHLVAILNGGVKLLKLLNMTRLLNATLYQSQR
jgi:hypothetical protein